MVVRIVVRVPHIEQVFGACIEGERERALVRARAPWPSCVRAAQRNTAPSTVGAHMYTGTYCRYTPCTPCRHLVCAQRIMQNIMYGDVTAKSPLLQIRAS